MPLPPASRALPRASEALRFLGLLLLSRLALLTLLARFTGGRELSDDVRIHLSLASDPLQLFLPTARRFAQYPPLEGLLEAAVLQPLRLFLPDFYAIRLGALFWETLLALAFLSLLAALDRPPRQRAVARALFLVLPMGWMSGVVMAEDEVLAALFLTLSLILVTLKRPGPALLVCGLGVVAGKIFLLAPLAVLILSAPLPRWKALAWGLTPSLLVYGGLALLALAQSAALPLAHFAPRPVHGTNLWVLLEGAHYLTAQQARLWSSALTLCALLPLLPNRPAPHPASAAALVERCALVLMLIWLLFYHVNPEYYLLCFPLLLAVWDQPQERLLLLGLSAFPWAINLFYGIDVALSRGTGGGKGSFAQAYQRLMPVAPHTLFLISLFLTVGLTALACGLSLRRLRATARAES